MKKVLVVLILILCATLSCKERTRDYKVGETTVKTEKRIKVLESTNGMDLISVDGVEYLVEWDGYIIKHEKKQ